MNLELQELRQAFAIEGSELLVEMESALLTLELRPDDADQRHCLFRTVHTIKGSAGIVGFDHLETFCHDLEHLLVRVREEGLPLTPPLINLFLQCRDHINLLMNEFGECGNDAYEPPARHEHLRTLITEWTPGQDGEAGEEVGSSPGYDNTASGADTARDKVVRVDTLKLDQLIDLVVELVTASSVLEATVRRLGDSAALESAGQVALLTKQIQEKSMVFRMIPVNDLFRRFRRIIHDIGAESGKTIKLEINGGETELDRTVAEKLREPLLHLVRNAIDHGLEGAEERERYGKPHFGTLRLQARQEPGHVVIEIADDGRGIDQARLLRKAQEKGLVTSNEPFESSEVLTILCEPGFSTRDEANLLSGRGMGMYAVRQTIEALRGRMELESTVGKGTTLRLRIPLSLSIIDGFMVSVGETFYIIPIHILVETLELSAAECRCLELHGYMKVRDELLPCLSLGRVLHGTSKVDQRQFVVVVRHDRQSVGLVVNSLVGEIKAVIKPLGGFFKNVSFVSGATILTDGAIALFLDTELVINEHFSTN